MESAASLSALGCIINNKEGPRPEKRSTNRVRRTPINADNVYNSWNLRKYRRKQRSIANDRHRKARKPMETGIIPNFYNSIKNVKKRKAEAIAAEKERQASIARARMEQFDPNIKLEQFDADSIFSDENSMWSNGSRGSRGSNGSRISREIDLGNNMAFFNKSNLLTNNKYHEQKIVEQMGNNGEPGFYAQFDDLEFNNPGDPVSSNNTQHQTGKFSNISRLEMERKLALKGNYSSFDNNQDMTYNVVDPKDFVHNNMVPFFKRGLGKGYGPDSIQQRKLDEMKQRKLERFSGSSKNIEYRPKTERRPLFNPHVGLTHIYGMPNFTNYFESRFIPGRERRNERIHQPVRITPGLNLGYNEIAKHGFHDTWRALPRTVDELRTANNPKISYGNVIIPGMKSVRRPIIPNVAKRRPITFKENDPRDFIKGTSYYRAPAIYGNFEAPDTNRQMTSRAWYGAAQFNPTLHKPESLYEQHRISHKENFLSPTPRNTTGVEREKSTTATANSYYLQSTNRQTTENRTWLNPAGPEYHRELGFDYGTNIPDPTMRNLTEKKTWNNPAGPEWHKPLAFDYGTNIPDPTLRNLTEKKTWNNPAGPEWQKHIAFDYGSNIPDPTLRNLTEKRTWNNPAGPEYKKHIGFDYGSNIPDPTLRNLTERRTWNNPAGPEYQKAYAFDYGTNIPDPTLRNLTERKTWNNPAGPEWQKPIAFDYQTNIPDPTLRNVTEKRTWNNPAGPEWQKHIAFDYQTNITDPTLRNTNELKTWNKPAYPEWKKGIAFDMVTNIPDPTIRNTTEVKTYQGPLGFPEREKGGYQVEAFNTIAPTTLRQLTQNKTYYAPLSYPERFKGAYQVDVQNTIAPTTLRQTTQNTAQIGHAHYPERMKGAYQINVQNTIAPTTLRQTTQNTAQLGHAHYPERMKGGYQVAVQNTIAPTTLRQTTQNTAQIGHAHYPERMKGAYQVNVQNTVAPTTLRQLTQNTARLGPAGYPEKEKGAYQINVQNTVAPPTLRQLTQVKTEYGPLGSQDREKGGYQVAVQNTIAPPTLRQQTQNTTQYGPLGSQDREKGGYQVAVQNTIAPTTLRQLTQHKTHYNGPILHEGQKTRTRADAENSLVNIAKEKAIITRDGGAPTTSNYEKGPTYEYTMLQLCEPIQIKRDLYPRMVGQRPLQCVPTMYTRIPNVLPHITSVRIDSCVTENLKSNPFINNIIHKSVEY